MLWDGYINKINQTNIEKVVYWKLKTMHYNIMNGEFAITDDSVVCFKEMMKDWNALEFIYGEEDEEENKD